MSDEVTITKVKELSGVNGDTIEYTIPENGNGTNAPEFLQFINLPILNISDRIQSENTIIVEPNESDDRSRSLKIIVDETECLLSNQNTSGVLDDHVIILHQGKQFLVRHDQINENGEVMLDEENAIDGFVFNDGDDDKDAVSAIRCDSDSNFYCRIDEQTGGSIEYDEEIIERFRNDNEDTSAEGEFYGREDRKATVTEGENSTNLKTEFSAEHFLEQIWYGGGPGRRKQFAILKDGKIHIQEGVVDDSSAISIEKHATNFDVAFENEIDGSVGENSESNSNFGITGRNLVTGQTISLDTFLSKIAARNKNTLQDDLAVKIKQEPGLHSAFKVDKPMFPKRLTVGHTASGKKIVGKILQIKRPGRDHNETEPFGSSSLSVQTGCVDSMLMTDFRKTIENDTVEIDSTGHLVECVSDTTGSVLRRVNGNIIMSRNEMDTLTKKTLCGLMDLETVQKNLIGRNLIVKNVHKKVNRKTDTIIHKNIKYFKGSFQKEENNALSDIGASWRFVENNDVNFVQRWSVEGTVKTEDSEVDSTGKDNVTDAESMIQNVIPESTNNSGHSVEIGTSFGQKVSIRSIEKINETLPKTLTVTVTVIEDENGKKRTKVVIPELSKVETHCSICDKFFRTAQHLRRHVKATHRPDEKSFQCDLCSKRFVDASTLTRHRRIHSGDKNHRCDLCSKAFNTAGSLKRHITVHNPNLRPLQCLTCLQRFTDESSLKKHMLLHTGIKPFECDVCYKRFVYHGDLNFHRKIHDPSKRFICDTCGKEFSRQSNLVRHLDIHKDNGNTFKCDICGITYNFMSSLTRHIVNNHMKDS